MEWTVEERIHAINPTSAVPQAPSFQGVLDVFREARRKLSVETYVQSHETLYPYLFVLYANTYTYMCIMYIYIYMTVTCTSTSNAYVHMHRRNCV